MTTPNLEGWVPVFEASTDYEADIVRDRLDSEGISAVVFTQRDHVFNLNVGDLARTAVLVAPEQADAARAFLATQTVSDAELEEAAMSADPISPDAHTPTTEAQLDSGIEEISFDVPDEDVPPTV